MAEELSQTYLETWLGIVKSRFTNDDTVHKKLNVTIKEGVDYDKAAAPWICYQLIPALRKESFVVKEIWEPVSARGMTGINVSLYDWPDNR